MCLQNGRMKKFIILITKEFCTQTDAAKYTFIYVLSVDEIQYFLAMRKGEVLEGSFQGELSDAKVHEEYQSEFRRL